MLRGVRERRTSVRAAQPRGRLSGACELRGRVGCMCVIALLVFVFLGRVVGLLVIGTLVVVDVCGYVGGVVRAVMVGRWGMCSAWVRVRLLECSDRCGSVGAVSRERLIDTWEVCGCVG